MWSQFETTNFRFRLKRRDKNWGWEVALKSSIISVVAYKLDLLDLQYLHYWKMLNTKTFVYLHTYIYNIQFYVTFIFICSLSSISKTDHKDSYFRMEWKKTGKIAQVYRKKNLKDFFVRGSFLNNICNKELQIISGHDIWHSCTNVCTPVCVCVLSRAWYPLSLDASCRSSLILQLMNSYAFWNEAAQDPCSKRTNVFFFRVWHNPSERSPLDKGRWSHLASAVDRSRGCSNPRRWPHRPSHIQLSLTFLALVFLGKALKIVTVERPFAMTAQLQYFFFQV